MYWDADSNVRDVFGLPRSLTKNNCCAISLAVLIMFFTASSCFFQNRFVQRLIRLVSAVLWGAAVSLPLAFIAYWLSHDGLMNADTLIAIWQTNPSEAVEYFSYKGAMFTVSVCFFAVLLSAISGSVRISVSGEVIPGAAQRGCPLYLRCSMPDLMR